MHNSDGRSDSFHSADSPNLTYVVSQVEVMLIYPLMDCLCRLRRGCLLAVPIGGANANRKKALNVFCSLRAQQNHIDSSLGITTSLQLK